MDDGIVITNRQNKTACPFRVVRRVEKPLGEGPEWSVECLEQETNLWGISFPEKKGVPAKQELIEALLECSRCKRFSLKLPVRIRLQDGQEEVTETQNLSKFGTCFVSTLVMEEANPLLVSLGHGPRGTKKEREARIVWRRQMEGANRVIYGLEIYGACY